MMIAIPFRCFLAAHHIQEQQLPMLIHKFVTHLLRKIIPLLFNANVDDKQMKPLPHRGLLQGTV